MVKNDFLCANIFCTSGVDGVANSLNISILCHTKCLRSADWFLRQVFFAHQGWTLTILEQEEIALPINGYLNAKLGRHLEPPSNCSTNSHSRESTPASSEGDPENFEINKFIELVDIKNLEPEDFVVDDDACQHCFWYPCVANLRPNWLGQGGPPMEGNNIIRKDRCESFRSSNSCVLSKQAHYVLLTVSPHGETTLLKSGKPKQQRPPTLDSCPQLENRKKQRTCCGSKFHGQTKINPSVSDISST